MLVRDEGLGLVRVKARIKCLGLRRSLGVRVSGLGVQDSRVLGLIKCSGFEI